MFTYRPSLLSRLSSCIVISTCLQTLDLASAGAATGNINFYGDITQPNACIINVTRDGVLAPNAGSNVLSSKEAGGLSGQARIISFWAYDLSIDPVPFFTTAPPGGNDNVNFSTTFSGQSVLLGRTFAERPGTSPVTLRFGFSVTDIDIHLVASRPDVYPAGDYEAVAIVRCE